MIKYFTFENYYSVKNESVLEFDLNLRKESSFVSQPVIGFAGANASGKSTILKALTFTLWFASKSFLKLENKEEIPVNPFITNKEKPCKFHIIFNIEGVDYEYVLEVTTQKIISEEFCYYSNEDQKLVYKREGQKIEFGEGINKIELAELRENSSIISFAAQFETQIFAKKIKEYNEFPTNIPAGGQFREIKFHPALVDSILENTILKEKTIEFLKLADVGIQDFFVQKDREGLFLQLEEMRKLVADDKKDVFDKQIQDIKNNENSAIIEAFFKHSIDGELINFEANEQNESSGTLQSFALFAGFILRAIDKGSLAIIDEIELKIHQNLVAYMIGLFQNPEVNTKNAQLIFSFHNTAFMEILSPEQLWFAEKNDQGHSDFYCAAKVTDIANIHKKNLETLYRIGRFGAKPKLL